MDRFLRTGLTLAVFALTAVATGAQTPPETSRLLPEPANPARLGAVRIETLPELPGISMAQDQRGFMWFAGWGGLFRYDGSDATTYVHDPQDPTSLPQDRLETIYFDKSGTLWVGTFGAGLSRFQPESGTFVHYRNIPGDPRSLPQDIVTVFLEDSRGTFWVGTHGGLSRFDREDGTFTAYRHDPENPASLSNDQVRVLYEDRQGTLWIGTGSGAESGPGEGGLNRYDPVTDTFQRYLHNADDPSSLVNNKVMSLFEDSRGTFWVGTLGDGLHTMDRAAGTFTRLRYDPDDPLRLSRPYPIGNLPQDDEACQGWACGGVSFIHEDRMGVLWIGALGGGMTRYDPDTGDQVRYESANSGLADNQLWRMAEAHDGTLFAGSWNGLHRIVSQAAPFPLFAAPGTADPLGQGGAGSSDPDRPGGTEIWSLHEDRQGMIWVGLNRGLDRWDRSTETFTHFVPDPMRPTSLAPGFANSILEDARGRLWIGLNEEGSLELLDRPTGQFTHYRQNDSDPTSLAGGIWTLLEDSRNRLWVGTREDGLDLFDRETGTFSHHRHREDDPRSLINNEIFDLLEDATGTLWVATEGGLDRYVETERAFERALPNAACYALLEDAAGRLWIGSESSLYLLDPVTGALSRFGREAAIPEGGISNIIEDGLGFLWLTVWGATSGMGYTANRIRLARFDPERGLAQGFGGIDGVPGIDFHPGASLRARDGMLLFAGNGGITALDPRTIGNIDRGSPRVTLTSLHIRNEEVRSGPDGPLRNPVHLTEEIRLSYGENDLTIGYAGLSFRGGRALEYQVMLENHDPEWINARTQQIARYSNLDPGTYVFRVRAIDERGLVSQDEASLRVLILPPWWRTIWAYTLYGLLLAGAVFGFDRFQRRRIVRRERERSRERELAQARAIEKAHAALTEAHEHLKSTQAQLVQQEKMASLGQLTAGIAHEIKNPLNFINNFAEVNEELLQEVKDALARGQTVEDLLADLSRNGSAIAQHGKRADSIVRSMMQHASGSTGKREAIDLNAMLSETLDLAYYGRRADSADFTVEIRRDLDAGLGLVEVMPQEMGRVILNLITNAFDAVSARTSQNRPNGPATAGTDGLLREPASASEGASGNDPYVPTVTVTTRRTASTVEICVSDNGPGVPHPVRDKIFEPFFTTKGAGSGTGLGLSLSYEIVTQGHAGTLTVVSEEGEGATFVVRLPAA